MKSEAKDIIFTNLLRTPPLDGGTTETSRPHQQETKTVCDKGCYIKSLLSPVFSYAFMIPFFPGPSFSSSESPCVASMIYSQSLMCWVFGFYSPGQPHPPHFHPLLLTPPSLCLKTTRKTIKLKHIELF